MAQPAAVEALSKRLRDAYARVWEDVVAEQESLLADPKRAVRRARLAAVRKRIEDQLDDLEQLTAKEVPKITRGAYALGGGAAAADAPSAGEFVWTQIHQQAVQSITNGLYKDLLASTKGVKDSTRNLVQQVGRDQSLKALIAGGTAKDAGKQMAKLIEQHGIHAVTYSDGSRHGLKEYGEMAQRTQTAIAYNEGYLNQATGMGVDWFEVFDGPTCGWTYHDDTILASGMVVDKLEAQSFPISHPNCRRTFGARPDIKTKTQAEKADPSVTEGQRQAQLAADRAASEQHLRDQIKRDLLPKSPDFRSRMQSAIDSGIKDEVSLSGGSHSAVHKVTFNNGTVAVRKVGGKEKLDRDELGSLVGERIGARVPATYRADSKMLYTEYMPNQGSAADLFRAKTEVDPITHKVTFIDPKRPIEELTNLAKTAEGRKIGLTDRLVSNIDRADVNLLVGTDGQLIAIDFDQAFKPLKSAFHGYGLPDSQVKNVGGYTRAEVEKAREALLASRDDFVKAKRTKWYDETVERYNKLADDTGAARISLSHPDGFVPTRTLEQLQKEWRNNGLQVELVDKKITGNVELSKVIVPKDKRSTGIGSRFMRDLTDWADANGKTLELTPSTDFGATSVNRLKAFYKQHGFVENKGKRPEISNSMFREPIAKPVEQIGALDKIVTDALDATAAGKQPLAEFMASAPEDLKYVGTHWAERVANKSADSWTVMANAYDNGYTYEKAVVVRTHVQNPDGTFGAGRTFLFEIDKDAALTPELQAVFQKQIDAVGKTLNDLPPKARNAVKQVVFSRGENPADAQYSLEFGKPGFVSTASAGHGTINVWGGAQARPSLILHETGHLVDETVGFGGEAVSGKGPWFDAATKDAPISAHHIGTTKPYSVKGHELTPGAASVTEYGATNAAEDYAESFRLWAQDRHAGFIGYAPDGTKRRFADLFPNRAELFDGNLGVAHAPDSAWKAAQKTKAREYFDKVLLDHPDAHGIYEINGAAEMAETLGLSSQELTTQFHNAKELQQSKKLIANAEAQKEAQAAAEAMKAKKATNTAEQAAVNKAVAEPAAFHAPSLTEKQTQLLAVMQEWQSQGIDVEALNVHQVMGKTCNLKQLKGIKKIDVEAAKNVLSGEAAKAAALDALSPLQKAYLGILKDWKATQGYDAPTASIHSVMGKLHKYPEIKGIKKADVEAVHQILAPGAVVTPKVAQTVTSAERKAKSIKVVSSDFRPGIQPGPKRKAGGFLNRSGDEAHLYRRPKPSHSSLTDEQWDAQDHLIPPHWDKASKAKHQLVGEITDSMADERGAWTAFQKSKAAEQVNYRNEVIPGTGKRIPDFDTLTHQQRYDYMYDEVNNRIGTWASTSGNEHYQALMMQKAIKDEFRTTGEVFAKNQAESMVKTVEEQYKHHEDWYRRFARAMYQNTQDQFAKEGITEISVFRGMRLPDSLDWGQPGAPRRIWLQPANSWSTQRNVSERFGSSIFEVTVSVDRVLGSARTGFGCLNEREFVILDTPGLAHLGKFRGRELPLEDVLK